MDFMIVFFRDVLDGPVYIVVASVCSILICSCIGYLGERYLKEKKEIKERMETHTDGNSGGRAAFEANKELTKEEAEKALRESLAPAKQEQGEVVQPIAEMPVEATEEEKEAAADPNANVNYNVTTISSDELLDDD